MKRSKSAFLTYLLSIKQIFCKTVLSHMQLSASGMVRHSEFVANRQRRFRKICFSGYSKSFEIGAPGIGLPRAIDKDSDKNQIPYQEETTNLTKDFCWGKPPILHSIAHFCFLYISMSDAWPRPPPHSSAAAGVSSKSTTKLATFAATATEAAEIHSPKLVAGMLILAD
jgi:hypothetical protein